MVKRRFRQTRVGEEVHGHVLGIDMARCRTACMECGAAIQGERKLAYVGQFFGLGKHDAMVKELQRYAYVCTLLRERAQRGRVYEGMRTLEEAEEELKNTRG